MRLSHQLMLSVRDTALKGRNQAINLTPGGLEGAPWAFSHVAQSSLSLPFFFFLNLFIYNRAESWSLSTVFL